MAFVIYTGLRLLLFACVFGVLFALGIRALDLWIWSFIVSGIISLFVLRKQRNSLSGMFSGITNRINDRIDRAARAEDTEDEDEATTDSPATDSAAADLTEPDVSAKVDKSDSPDEVDLTTPKTPSQK